MKVFGYPKFDENNEKILTTYDNEYQSMMMDVRVYRMSAGETRVFQKAEEETDGFRWSTGDFIKDFERIVKNIPQETWIQ